MLPGGVQFIHFETQTFVDSEVIQIMDLSQFGFKLYFPPRTSLEPVTFTVGVSLSRDFVPPLNTTLVSALYYIKASSELLRSVIIEIEHCVSTDSVDTTKLTFAKTDTNSLPPSVLEKIPGGRFGETAWGTIKICNFSQVMGVFVENANASNIGNYHAQFFTSRHKGVPGIYQYSVNLVIAHKLNAINKVIIIMSEYKLAI